ncbi:glycine--tRNA ligase subunit beta [Alcanivorax sp. 1008]|uniref:glycine--tRNA ligase subunit beta n=1 Tax=Alcanivorax sp. 1008 TaxID=2816853 RepID=UPI001DE78147|nr:glycine--tRNA ligase subunit beta [Alcanivorax sp. 1008]MCC1496180.1 glycine--tRNA ligase subunit beta [Alcanivorax sp. 1008]
MQRADLLIELGTEELPPKALKALSEAFATETLKQMDDAGLEHGAMKVFAAPRRLAFRIEQVAVGQADRDIERRGPAVKAAFDEEGHATKAALGFAQSVGLTMDQLETLETDKGAWLVAKVREPGKPLAELLPAMLEQSLQRLPIPKRMRWGNRKVQFVRPSQWLVALLGDQVLDITLLDQNAGRESRGHRFHAPASIRLASPAEYETRLENEGFVIADFDRRREMIRENAVAAGKKEGGVTSIDADLLDEVTALVEWPVAMVGHFEEDFLRVPQEALITTMESNQKYFPVLDGQGKLKNAFVFISNLDSKEPAVVISGNEKVVRPRLSDAAFFYDLDRKKTLREHAEPLEKVVFQQQLGSVADKCRRISKLAGFIAEQIGGNKALAEQAGILCKADLASAMVYEFDTMQGIMGYYLALNDGLNAEVAEAMREQYLPRFSGDVLPQTRTGMAVAIADKLDTLVGIFGIGQKPTGDKDPYALRRATLGILRIIIANKLDLDMRTLIDQAAQAYSGCELKAKDSLQTDVLEFVQGRYRAMYQEQGIDTPVILSVLAINPTKPQDVEQRIQAVAAFRTRPEAAALAAANKRVGNILSKLSGPAPEFIKQDLLQQDEEKVLFAALQKAITDSANVSDYAAVLASLAALRHPVDEFFEKVMVMADDVALRDNRLAMLAQLRGLFLKVADISELG